MDRIWIGVIVALLVALAIALRHNDDDERNLRQRTARGLIVSIDQGELCYRERFGRYTGRVSDFAIFGVGSPQVRAAGDGLHIELEASSDGRGYVQRITGEDVDYVVERRGREEIARATSGDDDRPLKPSCGRRR